MMTQVHADVLMKYIPREDPNDLLPATVQGQEKMDASEKEAIVRMLLKLMQEQGIEGVLVTRGRQVYTHQTSDTFQLTLDEKLAQ